MKVTNIHVEPMTTSTLVECLKLFNRKERYWLLRNALGEQNEEIPLSFSFRERLGEAIGDEIPPKAWWALDYHIDWLFAALVLDGSPEDAATKPTKNPETSIEHRTQRRLIRGTQEDFDFVIAFDRTIILIEAKGVTSWGNRQISSKNRRLCEWEKFSEQIQNTGKANFEPPRIIMVLMSAKKSYGLHELHWPKFASDGESTPKFLTMDFSGAPHNFLAPERCAITDKMPRPANDGDHWHFRSISRPDSREDNPQRFKRAESVDLANLGTGTEDQETSE